MRKLMLFLLCLGITLVSCSSSHRVQATHTQVDSIPRYLIDGHYYMKNVNLKLLPSSLIKGVGGINGDGFSVFVLALEDGFKFPEEWKQYEIPRKRVKNLNVLEEGLKAQEITSSKVPNVPCDSTLGDFSLKDLDGKIWNRASFLGHIVVVNMWYSGCGPCLREMPELSTWKAKYPDVLFFSANFEKADKVRRITTQRGFNWTHLVEDNYFLKWVSNEGYPVTIVIDPKGKVRTVVDGPKHWLILAAIDELLKEK